MSSKLKHKKVKALKQSLLIKVEATLSESLIGFPKKSKEKKFKKIIHKASKMIARTFEVAPVKSIAEKKATDKKKKTVTAGKTDTVVAQ
jgi:hypothetical protein